MRLRYLKDNWTHHIRANLSIYFFVVLLFLTGVVFGALAVRTLATDQKTELITYLQIFIADIASEELLTGTDLLLPILWANIKTAILIWLGGLTVIGLPLSLVLIFTKGFSSGFTVAFLVDEVKWRGFILAATAILPHSFFSIPALLFLSVGAVCFTFCVLRQRFFKHQGFLEAIPFWNYTLFILYASLTMVLASLVETYITPVLVKTTAGWLL
ncbi:MAG: stage II sporulation protein M [Firmicutes bacterium]|jgi:stage II sporulation protein M|nr:stage II sporulation protein M [Bacillota bacterium]